MTTINDIAHNRPYAGIWRRSTHGLGKLWAKMLASLEAPSAAAGREVPPEVWRFPPF
jgi:hypothetical protein